MTALPRMLLGFVLIVIASPAIAIAQPLIPFQATGNLFVLDHDCGCILEITPEGDVNVAVSKFEILAVTDDADVDFNSQGIAFTPDGTMYFVESIAEVLMKRTSDGTLSIVATGVELQAVESIFWLGQDVDMDGVTVGSDGNVYVMDEEQPASASL